MGARPRLSRNNTFNSCPDIDFDEYDMFDTPQRSKSTAYREVRGTNPYYDNPPTQRDSPPQRRSPSDGRSSEPFEEEELVPDTAKVMRTLNYIRTDLEYLRAVDIISEEQMEIIMEQLPQSLPVLYSQRPRRRRHRRRRSGSRDRSGSDKGNHKSKEEKDIFDWAVNVAKKFGNSAMFGLGATFAGDLMKEAMKKL